MSFKYIKTRIEKRILTITLNRPEKRNALNFEMVVELKEAFTKANSNENVKVIILTGEGAVFSAGADLAYLQKLQQNSYEENLEDSNNLKELFQIIYFHNKPVIALVQGHAIAGGCGLASVCDFIFSVPDAKFGYTEVKIGFVPAIVMIFLLRKIGEAKAKELLLTGKLITAEMAKDAGMVNEIFKSKDIENVVENFAASLANETSADSIRLTKQMIAEISSKPILEALNFAAEKNAIARETEDCKRGIEAFLNKEKLTW